MAGVKQIRDGDADGDIENQAVIRGDDETPASRRPEIDEGQERDHDRGHTTRRYFGETIEAHENENGKPERSGTKTPASAFRHAPATLSRAQNDGAGASHTAKKKEQGVKTLLFR